MARAKNLVTMGYKSQSRGQSQTHLQAARGWCIHRVPIKAIAADSPKRICKEFVIGIYRVCSIEVSTGHA
jgi:hypothetical protein